MAEVQTAKRREAAARPVLLRINGEVHVADVGPQATLLDVLREHLLLTGSKNLGWQS